MPAIADTAKNTATIKWIAHLEKKRERRLFNQTVAQIKREVKQLEREAIAQKFTTWPGRNQPHAQTIFANQNFITKFMLQKALDIYKK